MKIRRYTFGETNLAQLGRAREGVMSPQQAAYLAAGPYEAIAQAGRDIVGVAHAYQQEQQRLRDEEDQITAKLAAVQMRAAEARLKTDPKYRDQLQPDGTPTALAFLEDTEQHFKTVGETLEKIQDPRTRAHLQQVFELDMQVSRQDLRNFIDQKREAWNAQGELDLLAVAIEGSDYAFARQQTEDLAKRGILNPSEAQSAHKAINTKQTDEVATRLYDEWEAQRASGSEMEFYEGLVTNETLPPDVRDAAISKIETQMGNYEIIEKKRRTQVTAAYSRARTDLRMAIEKGQAGPAQIEELVRQMDAFNDPQLSKQASTWRNELYLATLDTAKVDLKQQRFNQLAGLSLQEGGQPGWVGPSDAPSRKNMTTFVADAMTDDLTPEQQSQLGMELIKRVGIPTEDVFQLLEAGGAALAEQPLIAAAETWIALSDANGEINVNDGLTTEGRAAVIMTANKMRAGMQPLEAAQQAIAARKYYRDQPEEVRFAIDTKFKEDVDIEQAWNDLKTDSYLDVRWGPGGEADVFSETVATGWYYKMLHDAYISSSGQDPAAAVQAATMQFQQLYPVTYVNGQPEVQFGGMGGDESREIGKTLRASLEGKTYRATSGGNARDVTLTRDLIMPDPASGLDLVAGVNSPVSLRNPRKIDGQMDYQVYFEDAPMIDPATRKTVHVVVDKEVVDAADQSANKAKRLELEAQIAEMETWLRNQQEFEQRGGVAIYGVEEMRNKKRDLPKEINRLRNEIAELGNE